MELQLNNVLRQPRHFILPAIHSSQGRTDGLINMHVIDEQKHGRKVTKIPFKQKLQGKPALKIVATCNGLLCLSESGAYTTHSIIIYNPVTRESETLPELATDRKYQDMIHFGCDAKREKYKVISICSGHKGRGDLVGYVITLGESSWRTLDLPEYVNFGRSSRSVLLNGEFYSIIERNSVLAFDICNEKFRVIKLVNHSTRRNFAPAYNLVDSGKHLSLFVTSPLVDEGMEVQLWSLIDSKKGIWTHQSTHKLSCYHFDLKVAGCIDDDSLFTLFTAIHDTGSEKFFSDSSDQRIVYNSKSGKHTSLHLRGSLPRSYGAFSYIPSFLSPKF